MRDLEDLFKVRSIPNEEWREFGTDHINNQIGDIVEYIRRAHETVWTLERGYQASLIRLRRIAIQEAGSSPACAAIVQIIDNMVAPTAGPSLDG